MVLLGFVGYLVFGLVLLVLLVYWFIGLLVYWFIGLLVYWFIGLLVYWFIDCITLISFIGNIYRGF